MTDDTDRPRPDAPKGTDDGAPTEAFRRRGRRGEDDSATEPPRPGAGTDADGDVTRASSWNLASDDAADQGAAPAGSWSLGSDDAATQAFRWDPDADPTARAEGALTEAAPADVAPVDPSLDGAPAQDGQPPTEAMTWETAVVPEVAPGGPLPRVAPEGRLPRTPDATVTGPTGIDALFQPGSFRDFEPTTVLPREPRTVGATAVSGARTRPSLTPGQRTLLWAAGVLVAILVLLALFAIGRRLPAMFAAAPASVETVTPTPTSTPEPVDPAAGPLPPGEYAWDELRGGECLEPYESAWQEDYTVVDCGEPHSAQLLVRGTFPEDAAPEDAAYPGFDELAGRINLLCTDPKVIDFDAAREFDDIVVEGAHAVTPEEWDQGHRDYFCFLTRSSGDPLTETLAVEGGE